MRAVLLGALVLAVPLVGCTQEATQGETSYELRGTFTEEAEEGEMGELEEQVEARGGKMFRLESFPVQFHATGLDENGCVAVRDFAQDADYVADVGACQPDRGASGAEPTSDGS